MKLISLIKKTLLLVLFTSCVGNSRGGINNNSNSYYDIEKASYKDGDLLGLFPGVSFESVTPKGGIFVSSGTFSLGGSGGTSIGRESFNRTKEVSITALYVDETEVTNSGYRQFINIVEEDLIRKELAEKAYELENNGQELEGGILDYSYLKKDSLDGIYYEYIENTYKKEQSFNLLYSLNFTIPIIKDENLYPDIYYAEVMDKYYIFDERGERVFDRKKIIYNYEWIDLYGYIKSNGGNIKDFVYNYKVKAYPKEDVWSEDFSYSYNEPLVEDYFNNYAFSDYPVVGVSWNQAKAFCFWRTDYKNRYNIMSGDQKVRDFRLPSEVEWEYVARANIDNGVYPWGGNYITNHKGEFLANLKPLRGNYTADEHMYTSKVKSFPPNDFGLYDMAGNVSEWTNTSYREDVYDFFSTITPDYTNPKERRATIRGGSWKDFSHALRVYVRDFEYKNEQRSYIGFRTLQEYQGEKIGRVDLEVYFEY